MPAEPKKPGLMIAIGVPKVHGPGEPMDDEPEGASAAPPLDGKADRPEGQGCDNCHFLRDGEMCKRYPSFQHIRPALDWCGEWMISQDESGTTEPDADDYSQQPESVESAPIGAR
jgi:hypothetical protein